VGRRTRARTYYDATKAALAEVGFICEGSLARIYTCCRNPNCRCADPARRHGPYWQLTWKQDGRTVSRRLSAEEAPLYAEWIDNRRRLEAVITEMRSISRHAGQQLLAEIGKPLHGPDRAARSLRSPPRRS